MNYQSWSQTALRKITITTGTTDTAVWCDQSSKKPLVVLVHGLSGDHYGLVPLAYELSDIYRIAIVELPGHGDSDSIPLSDAASLEIWFETVLSQIVEDMGRPAFICTHSFASLAVLSKNILSAYPTVLLNPVPTPSRTYIWYAKLMMHTARLWAQLYNWHPLVYMRGLIVTRVFEKDARTRVHWVGYRSKINYRQAVYQSRLITMALDNSVYAHAADGQVRLVICGTLDVIPLQRDVASMRSVFGSTKIEFVRGGHIMPIESPRQVAAIIKSFMIH